MSPSDRSRVLHRGVASIAAHREELIDLIVAEIGCPIALTRTLQVDVMLQHLSWFADAAARGPDGGFEQALVPDFGAIPSAATVVREPVGVVAAITPYNIPLLSAVWKVGAALAAGCTAILLPSPRAQLTSIAFVRLLEEADLPVGTLQLLLGDAEIGRELTEHPDVDLVTFTGSVEAGRQVARQAASTAKKVILELGGKSPNLVLPGADAAEVVGPSILRFTRNAGQACGATTRTFVPVDDYDSYAEASASFMSELAVGSPWDEGTVVGPLIRREHLARVEGFVDRAIANGARIEAGGGRPDQPSGYFMNPVLVGAVSNSTEIAQEELFGPVGVLIPYESVDEAVALANQSRFGLNANVWGPTGAAHAVARRIRSGTVTINGGGALRADAPFGGYRQSGVGREAGEEGFREFFETKLLQWRIQ
jgi:aldehyde dehydrogenase (NAD+)/betaine-aldehyde dehydrogenase